MRDDMRWWEMMKDDERWEIIDYEKREMLKNERLWEMIRDKRWEMRYDESKRWWK